VITRALMATRKTVWGGEQMIKTNPPSNKEAVMKNFGLGALIWVGGLLMLGIGDLSLPNSIIIRIFEFPVIVVILFAPALVIILLILDIIHVIRDKDAVYWYKRWFQIIAGMAIVIFAFCAIVLPLILR
jgi:hypothetical protein